MHVSSQGRSRPGHHRAHALTHHHGRGRPHRRAGPVGVRRKRRRRMWAWLVCDAHAFGHNTVRRTILVRHPRIIVTIIIEPGDSGESRSQSHSRESARRRQRRRVEGWWRTAHGSAPRLAPFGSAGLSSVVRVGWADGTFRSAFVTLLPWPVGLQCRPGFAGHAWLGRAPASPNKKKTQTATIPPRGCIRPSRAAQAPAWRASRPQSHQESAEKASSAAEPGCRRSGRMRWAARAKG